jgi:ATP-dependent helicase/nuclease subunit A
MNKLQIFKASAGSGKTYLLTENYLKLAFEQADNFTKILAVTFTNKAAGEMKARILSELNNIILKGKKAEHYKSISEHIHSESENYTVQRAKSVRDSLLHNYSMFYVGTIDSFVQKVVRSFAYEMNLNSSFDIEMDRNKVISDLTEKLYEQSSQNKELRNWLIQYAEHKINEGKAWDFRSEVKNLSEEIFKENFQSLFVKAEEDEIEQPKNQVFKSTLYGIKKNFENQMTDISIRYESILKNAKINHTQFGRNFQTISNHFLKNLPEKKYDDIKITLINAKEGPEKWYAKSANDQIKASITSVYSELNLCLSDFFQLFESESENYYTADAILQNYYSFGILNDIASFLPEYRNSNNVLLISDTNLLLKEIIGNNDAPFIYEKFGNRFNHILIDEFQDTSGFQWLNFKPLIENSLSFGNYNMIVGDIKQSIYRWRNGNWKLLHEQIQKDIAEHFISEQTLNSNWRSKENIVQFNNSLFKKLPEMLQMQYNNDISSINDETLKEKLRREGYTDIIQKAYNKHEQTVPDQDEKKGGTVKLFFTHSSNNTEYNKKVYDVLPETIESILRNGHAKASEIGILVRRNAEAKTVADMLLQYQKETVQSEKYQIISPESLYIGNSPSVKIIISAMKCLQSSENDINTAELIFEFQKFKGNTQSLKNDLFLSVKKNEYGRFLPEAFLKNKNELKRTSLYELSERLIEIFDIAGSKKDFLYLKSFQNLISEQLNKQNSNLSDFLDWWNEKGKEKSVQFSDETNALRIMTIHSSKGLAFKYVFIPFADMKIDHGVNSPLLWVKTDKEPFNSIKYFPVKYNSKLIQSYFAEDYLNEKLYAYIDTLNLLYVAFTRAKSALYIFSSFPKTKKNEYSSAGHLLHSFVTSSLEHTDQIKSLHFSKDSINEFNVFSYSEEAVVAEVTRQKQSELENVLFAPVEYPNSIFQDRIHINYSSEDFFTESIDNVENMVNYGIFMHQVFAQIHYKDDVSTVLEAMISEGYISENEKKQIADRIYEIISRDNVKEWFSQDYNVITEEALITAEGDIRIPDRVILSDDKIIVIDFKFGKKHKKYFEQIKEYKELIEEVYEQKTEAYIYYVVSDFKEQV